MSVAARLKKLEEEQEPDCGDVGCLDCAYVRELAAIRAEVERLAAEMRAVRELYGDAVPFDPSVSGFDSALTQQGQRAAVCKMMNAVLNDQWADALSGESET